MEEYAHRKNIERFEHDLLLETDPARRALLKGLLRDERAHLESAVAAKIAERKPEAKPSNPPVTGDGDSQPDQPTGGV